MIIYQECGKILASYFCNAFDILRDRPTIAALKSLIVQASFGNSVNKLSRYAIPKM